MPTSITPCEDTDRERFAKAMGACLALVAPSGMAQDARRVWMEAAFAALRHLPIDVIERGAADAQRTADHPSKLVPTIIATTEAHMAWRRRMNTPRPAAETPALPSPTSYRGTASELDAICRKYGVGRHSAHRAAEPAGPAFSPCKDGMYDDHRKPRMPTRADYIAMGVDPAILDASEDAA